MGQEEETRDSWSQSQGRTPGEEERPWEKFHSLSREWMPKKLKLEFQPSIRKNTGGVHHFPSTLRQEQG